MFINHRSSLLWCHWNKEKRFLDIFTRFSFWIFLFEIVPKWSESSINKQKLDDLKRSRKISFSLFFLFCLMRRWNAVYVFTHAEKLFLWLQKTQIKTKTENSCDGLKTKSISVQFRFSSFISQSKVGEKLFRIYVLNRKSLIIIVFLAFRCFSNFMAQFFFLSEKGKHVAVVEKLCFDDSHENYSLFVEKIS